MTTTQQRPGEVTHGLYLKRPRTCPCGAVFVARTPQATYCSAACRVAYTRYGNPGSVAFGYREGGPA